MECKEKPEIAYPCQWSYKVIGSDREAVRLAVEYILEGREYILVYSHQSRTGRYHSWSIDLVVASEDERNLLFAAFKNHLDIKIVI